MAGRRAAGSTGRSQGAAASGTATTRSGASRNRSIACLRTVSPGVTIMVAIPKCNNTGVRRATRAAAECQPGSIHGERS